MASLYRPPAFALDDIDAIRDITRRAPLAQLVLTDADGFLATPVPLILNTSADRLIGHLAKPNRVTKHILAAADSSPCIVIFTGADGYVSPSAYPSKREHGKVVPTWNYETVHVHGRVIAHPDAEWTLQAVRTLTTHFERDRIEPWADTDAPPDYIDGLLGAIVGVEIVIGRIEAKRKLSQNRPEPDRRGVLADVESRGADGAELATQMAATFSAD